MISAQLKGCVYTSVPVSGLTSMVFIQENHISVLLDAAEQVTELHITAMMR